MQSLATISRTKPVRTAAVALVLMLGLIAGTVLLLKKLFAPAVTRENSQIVFDAFSQAVAKGDVSIPDDQTAVALAKEAIRKQTDSVPMDGWGLEMRMTAQVSKGSCTLTARSAGPDHVFDTPDDLTFSKKIDLTKRPPAAAGAAPSPQKSQSRSAGAG